MNPTIPGSYEFKGSLSPLLPDLVPKVYPYWTYAQVYRDEESGRLCAKVFDEDGHYSAGWLIQFNGQWRNDSTTQA